MDIGQLKNYMMQSPTGQKLMQQVEAQGTKIQITPDDGSGENGHFDPETNTIELKEKDLETMIETIAHESSHAITPEDGNSMEEEKNNFKLGEKVAQEAGVCENPKGDAFWDKHVEDNYSEDGLPEGNGHTQKMYALGINPFEDNNQPVVGGETQQAKNINSEGIQITGIQQAQSAEGTNQWLNQILAALGMSI